MRNVARFSPHARRTLRPRHRARLQVEQLESRSLPSVYYTPAQIRTAYGVDNLALDGAGQTIAIVDAYNDPKILSDANTFSSNSAFNINLPLLNQPGGPWLKQVNQTGGTKLPAGNYSWGMEISLDVEWAHAIAPGANILLVEASSNSFTNLLAAVDYASAHANVVSMSWGGSEPSNEVSLDSHFQAAGVTYVASSGDNGSGASWPASSAYVLAVGGTTLNLTSSNTINSETGWSGSGGGPSTVESDLGYQQTYVPGHGSMRTTPDVAYNADPNTGFLVYDSYVYRGWYDVGGTSAGAPQWAALAALADQARGSTGVGSTNSLSGSAQVLPTLYSLLADSTTYNNSFNDIKSGSNGAYSAGPGYDEVTGLGSPKASAVVAALAATTFSPNTTGSGTSSPTGSSGTSGRHHSSPTTPVAAAPTGPTAAPVPVVTATLTSGTTALLTQPQFSVATLPGTTLLGGSVQATAQALIIVGAPAARPVWIVGAEDPVTDNTEGGTGGAVAPAGPAAVPPDGPGAATLSPGLGQGVRMGVEVPTDNGPMMSEEGEEAAALGEDAMTAGPTAAFAGLALALSGYWGLPWEESAEQRRIRAKPAAWPKG
jgi:subtilase family serine protease